MSTKFYKKAYWYRVFDPNDIEPSYDKILPFFGNTYKDGRLSHETAVSTLRISKEAEQLRVC